MKTKEQILSENLDTSGLPDAVIDKIHVAMEKWASEVEGANRAAAKNSDYNQRMEAGSQWGGFEDSKYDKPYSPSEPWGEIED